MSGNLTDMTASNPSFEATMASKRRRLSESSHTGLSPAHAEGGEEAEQQQHQQQQHLQGHAAAPEDDGAGYAEEDEEEDAGTGAGEEAYEEAYEDDADGYGEEDGEDGDGEDGDGEDDYVPGKGDGDGDDDDDDFQAVGGYTRRAPKKTPRSTRSRGGDAAAAITPAEGRSYAPDEGSDDDNYDEPGFSEEYLRRQRNIMALKAGNITVERQTVMPHLLHLTPAERKCYEPFIPHMQIRTQESDTLVRKKTLGMRGIRNYKTTFQGVARLKTGAGAGPDAVVPCEPLILWRPDEDAHEKAKPIELENFICHWLRPHQRSGVQFLFDCVTGLKEFGGEGCILADDMGLGKTLMSIALIWIVLRHGFEGKDGPKICKKIVVCCPTSLVFNWNNEVTKWLKGKVQCIAVGNTSSSVAKDIGDFFAPRCKAEVLVLSYETFRTYKEVFYAPGKVDLLICDEAHRLKNDQTQTSVTLAALPTLKRVLLSGTPLQNRLDEFYAMVNFCNPGVLGTPSEFRKNFERPILAGMEPDCTDAVTARAKETSAKLSGISNQFILRRTNALLAKHLPTKLVQVVCCKPTPLQVQLYNHFLNSKAVKKVMQESDAGEGGRYQSHIPRAHGTQH